MMELHPASIINFIPIGLIKGFSGVDYLFAAQMSAQPQKGQLLQTNARKILKLILLIP